MERDELRTLLTQSAEDVLERMFFAGALGPAPAPASEADSYAVEVQFTGSRTGMFRMVVSRRAADALTGNFLGLDGGPEPGQTAETVCELANMICGSALSKLPAEERLVLSAPRIAAGTTGAGTGGSALAVCLDLGEGVLDLDLKLERIE